MKRVKDVKRLEELAREKGYTGLIWYSCCENFTKETKKGFEDEKTKFVLCGCPKNYDGPFSDYNEEILVEVVTENRLETRGYKWADGRHVKKWVME